MRKKKAREETKRAANPNVRGLRAAVEEQDISETLMGNYMPYAMSVIVSRAIPEIDGFKPAHRKLLYTMYQMGLLTKARTKSVNIVGQTMRLNPHGDSAIYDTMVCLSKGYGALLHPFVDSKGNFGKVYSRDMAWAASRYTEAKLSPVCQELFRDLDQDAVDFIDNYDNTMKEPSLLPTTFPNILVSANQGIAVGMASQLCGFNLGEVCDAAAAYLKDPGCDLTAVLLGPDFPTGGDFIYDANVLRDVYETGRGSMKIRGKYRYIKGENVIEIYEIPYTTTSEVIIDKVEELIKAGKIREVNDMRDETDLSGLKLAIDLKRGVDPDKFMAKLFKLTPLQDTLGCNFNVLINGYPKVLGVREILKQWCAWRTECIRRRTVFSLQKKKEKLHLLLGLKSILLDIDRAIRIIRETEADAEVIFITNKQQAYKCRLSGFDDTKASAMGDFLPAKLGMDAGESVLGLVLPGEYQGYIIFFYENGKASKVDLSTYATASNRKKLTGAYSNKSPLVAFFHLTEDTDLVLKTTEVRAIILNTVLIPTKSTRSAQGNQVIAMKPKFHLSSVTTLTETPLRQESRYRCRSIPSAGQLFRQDDEVQMALDGFPTEEND